MRLESQGPVQRERRRDDGGGKGTLGPRKSRVEERRSPSGAEIRSLIEG